jgi:hypothetical protein
LVSIIAKAPVDLGRRARWLEIAAELASRSPCDPKTLTRAARDFVNTNPEFALKAGLAAMRWLAAGYGYEVNGADVWAAYSHTMTAAEQVGRREGVRERIRALVANQGFVAQVLGRELGLPTP